MKSNNTFKRVAAGALAAISVAGYSVPANVGGFLNNTNVLIADAAAVQGNVFNFDSTLSYAIQSITATTKKQTSTQYVERTYDTFDLDGLEALDLVKEGSTVTIKSDVKLSFGFNGIATVSKNSDNIAKALKVVSSNGTKTATVNDGYIVTYDTYGSGEYIEGDVINDYSDANVTYIQKVALSKANNDFTETYNSNEGYTYTFVMPDSEVFDGYNGIRLIASQTQLDVINPEDGEDLGVYIDNTAALNQIKPEDKVLKKVNSNDIKFFSGTNSMSGADINDISTDLYAYQEEEVKIASKKPFGVWVWDGIKDSAITYESAYLNTDENDTVFNGYYVATFKARKADNTMVVLTAEAEIVDYIEQGSKLIAQGGTYSGNNVAEVFAKFKDSNNSDKVTDVNTQPNNTVKNATDVTLSLSNVGEVIREKNGTCGKVTITKNKGYKDTEKKVSANFGGVKADETLTKLDFSGFFSGSDLNEAVTKGMFDASSTVDGLVINQAGHYDVEIEVYVDTFAENGSISGTTAKKITYSFDIATKELLSPKNVYIGARVKNGSELLVNSDGETTDLIEPIPCASNGYASFRLDADEYNNEVIEITAEVYGDITNPAEPEDEFTNANSALVINGETLTNDINTAKKLTITYINPEYSPERQTIEVNYTLVNKIVPTATWIGEENKGQFDSFNNYNIQIGLDRIETLKSKIFDNFLLNNIEEDDVTFEYSTVVDKAYDITELDWRESGLPSEPGEYTVFLTYKGEAFGAVNVIIVEHTVTFVPSEESLSIVYGDDTTFYKDFTITDINGKAVKLSEINVTPNVYRVATDEKGNILKDENGAPRVANKIAITTNKNSPFYNKKYPKFSCYYTYDSSIKHIKYSAIGHGYDDDYAYADEAEFMKSIMELYSAYNNSSSSERPAWVNYFDPEDIFDDGTIDFATGTPDFNYNLDYYDSEELENFMPLNAGQYVVSMDGNVDKRTGYAVEKAYFLYNVDQAQLDEEMVIGYPGTYKKNTERTVSVVNYGDELPGDGEPYFDITEKYDAIGLKLDITGTTAKEDVPTERDADGNLIGYPVKLSVKSGTDEEYMIANRNFKGTLDSHWFIVKDGSSQNLKDLEFDIDETTLGKNATVRVALNRPADTALGKNAKVKRFGIIADIDGKLEKPKYAEKEDTADVRIKNYREYDYSYETAEDENDIPVLNAYNALQLGNGFVEDTQTAKQKANDPTHYTARLMPRTVESGMWIRSYIELEDGTIYYGKVRFVSLQEEAEYQLSLKIGGQFDNDESDFYVRGKTYAQAKKELNIKSTKDTMTDKERNDIRNTLQSGYNPESNSYYVYGSYSLNAHSEVKPEAVNAFGVLVDDLGSISYNGYNSEGKYVKSALKLGEGDYLVGQAKANNKTYTETEYGAKVLPYNEVSGIWARCYVDLGDGIVVYTDPQYFASISEYYVNNYECGSSIYEVKDTMDTDGVTASKNQKRMSVYYGGFSNIDGIDDKIAVQAVGVVADASGALFNKSKEIGYTYKYKNTSYGAYYYYGGAERLMDSDLVLGNGYRQGKKSDQPIEQNDNEYFYIKAQKDADDENIPLAARSFVTLKIFGNEVTIYGSAQAFNSDTNNEMSGGYMPIVPVEPGLEP